MSGRPDVSFVIPAFNEEGRVGAALDSIVAAAGNRFAYEIVVADNGSSDGTARAAARKGARVLTLPGLTISALRNAAARASSGEILAFVDADVRLAPAWGAAMEAAKDALRTRPGSAVTGAMFRVDGASKNWIELAWFAGDPSRKNVNFINSGNLVVARGLFEKIGGFDEALSTSEDVDFCRRARKAGAEIVNDPRFEAVHDGFPKDLAGFFRKERWHSRGCASPRAAFVERTTALAFLQLVLAPAGVAAALVTGRALFAAGSALLVAALGVAAALRKSPKPDRWFAARVLLGVVFFAARNAAFFDWLSAGRVSSGREGEGAKKNYLDWGRSARAPRKARP